MRRLWPHPVRPVRRLRKGDRVAIVAPSSGLATNFPGVYRRGLEALRELGLEPVEFCSATMSSERLYRSPELRARDLRDALVRGDIHGIVSVIGGHESVRLLPLLRSSDFAGHPTFIMGGSDATTYLLFARRAGIVGFYGPSVMAGLSQMDDLPDEYRLHLERFLFEPWESFEYGAYPSHTHGYTGWSGEGSGGIQPLQPSGGGWSILQGSRPVEGHLFGGCIEVLEFLKGTPYWPPPGFFRDAVLFLETSEEKPSPQRVGYMLRNYGVAGVLRRVAALLIGRPKDYSTAEVGRLHETVLAVVKEEFGLGELPIISNVDFGHTDPKLIVPIGCRVRIDPNLRRITLLESPFSDS